MKWLEICVETDSETAEAVSEVFNRYAPGGAVVEVPVDCFEYELSAARPAARVLVKAYLPQHGGDADRVRQRLEEGLWHLSQIVPIAPATTRELAEEDWANSWKQQYRPLRVGHSILIVPAWETHQPAPEEVTIRLEPGMAFGTGLHPTTRQCLHALETHLPPGSTVLDVGTGSGILAIAAAKLGAGSVLALDSDPVAVSVAQENVMSNGVADRVTVRLGSLPGGVAEEWLPRRELDGAPLPLLDEGRYDVVVVNILAPVIVGMVPALVARTVSHGCVIAAGFIDSQEGDVTDTFRAHGMRVTHRAQEADWVSLVARRE